MSCPARNASYKPREQASPSAISTAELCDRKWFYIYVEGRKELKLTWAQAKRIPKPKGKDAVKAWNKLRRPAIGHEGHSIIERWYESFRPGAKPAAIDWNDLPGRVMLAGLPLLPHPSTLRDWFLERPVAKDFTSRVVPGLNYEFNGYIDLVPVGKDDTFRVIDHKTTSSFDWVKTPQELIEDPQGIVYPLDVMLRHNLERIACRWVYYRTEGTPKARAVDFMVTREGALRRALPLVNRGAELVNNIRNKLTVDQMPANTAACDQFGGCMYHHSRGGPCEARRSVGKILRVMRASTKAEQERTIMGFRKNAQAAGVIGGGDKPANTRAAAPAEDAASSEPAQEQGETSEAQDSQQSEAPARGARRGGARRRGASDTDAGTISLVFESGATIAIPQGSALYEQAAAVHSAFFPAE